jgi:hypothetical protein
VGDHEPLPFDEHATPASSDDDVRVWCDATAAPEAAEALLADLHTLQTRHQEWQRLMRGGMASVQAAIGDVEARTRILRNYQSALVPGLMQTPEYARAVLERAGRVWTRGTGVDEAVAARMRRQEALYDRARKFHFIVTEAVLMYAICEPAAMLGQLDRLMSLSMLPNVRLGIVPFARQTALVPKHAFAIYDDKLVKVETVAAELNLAQPQEIELHRKVFESMALDADYDDKARAILHRVGRQIAARQMEND